MTPLIRRVCAGTGSPSTIPRKDNPRISTKTHFFCMRPKKRVLHPKENAPGSNPGPVRDIDRHGEMGYAPPREPLPLLRAGEVPWRSGTGAPAAGGKRELFDQAGRLPAPPAIEGICVFPLTLRIGHVAGPLSLRFRQNQICCANWYLAFTPFQANPVRLSSALTCCRRQRPRSRRPRRCRRCRCCCRSCRSCRRSRHQRPHRAERRSGCTASR